MVTGNTVTERLADVLNLPPGTLGYIVKVVAKGSPAETLGLRGGTMKANIADEEVIVGGDIILSVEGIQIRGPSDMVKIRDTVNRMRPGQSFKTTVLRAGRVLGLTGKIP